MSACETLCWIGYNRAIPQNVYYHPLTKPAPKSLEKLPSILHRAIPKPKPKNCPMSAAEAQLIEALRSGEVQAFSCDKCGENPKRLVPADFDFAVAVSCRGTLEPDQTASDEDQNLARAFKRKNIRFFTSQIVKRWPSLESVNGPEPNEALQTTGEAPASMDTADDVDFPTNALTNAPKDVIRSAIKEIYEHAKKFGMKPPNVNELPREVSALLAFSGLTSYANKIKTIAEEPPFKAYRQKRGARVYGSLSAFSLKMKDKSGVKT